MTTQTNSLHRKLPFSVKLGYGFGGFATLFTLTLVSAYGMLFFTTVVKLGAAFVGLMLGIGILWDAITDPLVGYWSDSRDSRLGRRRPFLLWVSVPFGLSVFLLFTQVDFGSFTKLYYVIIFLFYYTVHTVFDVPYTALAGEMTLDYDERTSINTFRRWASDFAGIAGGLFMTLVGYLTVKYSGGATPDSEAATAAGIAGWSHSAAIWGIVCIIAILICWKTTKGYEMVIKQEPSKFKIKNFIEPWTNKPFLYVMGQFSAGLVAQAFVNAFFGFYFMVVVGFSMAQIGTLLMISFAVSAILWTPTANILARKISKKSSYNILFVFALVMQVVLPVLLIKPGMITVGYLYGVIYGAFNAPLWMITWAMIPDCIEVDELKTGKRREGMFFGVLSFVQKASVAIAMALSGIVLEATGFNPESVPTADILNNITNVFAYMPAAFMVISVLVMVKNPMTRESHSALLEIIQSKKEGKEYSTESIEKLL